EQADGVLAQTTADEGGAVVERHEVRETRLGGAVAHGVVDRRECKAVRPVGVAVPEAAPSGGLARPSALRIAEARAVGNRRRVELYDDRVARVGVAGVEHRLADVEERAT